MFKLGWMMIVCFASPADERIDCGIEVGKESYSETGVEEVAFKKQEDLKNLHIKTLNIRVSRSSIFKKNPANQRGDIF